MRHFLQQSLLGQLLTAYLLFVVIVLSIGIGSNAVIEQRLQHDMQSADQALAQEIALNTSLQLTDAETSLAKLGSLVAQATSTEEIRTIFRGYQAAQAEVDYVYWLNPVGALQVVWPQSGDIGIGAEFSPPDVIERARASTDPVYEVGIAVETTFNAGVIIADPVFQVDGKLMGIVAISLSLDELSEPLTTVVNEQLYQGRHLLISIIDSAGELIATPQHDRILQTALDELPGADQALQGTVDSRLGRGPNGQDWLFSSVPVPHTGTSGKGWAVVVERPASEALAVVTQFHIWLLTAALLFALGGLLFWLILLMRVIRPLHTLAIQHQSLPTSIQAIPAHATALAGRNDEVGGLARSLVRLERDGLEKLSELHTLLDTSNAVVQSLDPYAVVGTIIREARRLVNVQAVAVLAPNEQGVLRVLGSEGHGEKFDHTLSLTPENTWSTAVLALRNGQPTQRLLGPEPPSLAFEEGYRSVLAIPIISRYVGGVVLSAHRTQSEPFNDNEIDLLLTFANYATLAWEHAVLYERSDERLREVAHENARLYQQAAEEKQTLAAIMGSMSDGLVLTGPDGTVLYANLGIRHITGLSNQELEHHSIHLLYEALQQLALDQAESLPLLAKSESGEVPETVIEIRRDDHHRAIHLRLFGVDDSTGKVIGRGLLLRDVTREYELDEFKSALLAAVGHELRTPLAAIKGHASTLLQEDVTWPLADQRHFLETISSEADRLALLVSNLLDLSRQEAGLLLLNRTPLRLQDVVAQIVGRLQHPGVELAIDVPEDLPLVNADSARIEVVLQNLITNALKYGESAVRIAARQESRRLVVAISDNGPGIAPDELPRIFERFYRTARARQQYSDGTGLGLTICKAFIEAHDGSISAEGNAHGTTISFTLPLDETSDAPAGASLLHEAANSNSGEEASGTDTNARDGAQLAKWRSA